MDTTLQEIFCRSFDRYAQGKRLPLQSHKAARAIMQCRTAALGGHVQHCPDGHVSRNQYNSCKHRSCPRCAALPKARWAEAQHARLLGCDHYHVVFTLPHELLALWSSNRAWFIDALFQSCRDTLMVLLKDPRYLGATPGILMSLHTWGRTLSLHPHIHCLVTGGGLSGAGQWMAVNNGYLLPVRVVKAMYRGKLLARLWAALSADTLKCPEGMSRSAVVRLLKAVAGKAWNVRLQERYAHGRGVMLYLSRYVKGGPISDRRVLSADGQAVAFRYKDHRDNQIKVMRLATGHFIQRVLWHVPETGQHTIRHYGLYAHQGKPKRAVCREQLGQAPEVIDWQAFWEQLGRADKGRCPHCGRRLVPGVSFGRRRDENSIANGTRRGLVQQSVEADTRRWRLLNSRPPD